MQSKFGRKRPLLTLLCKEEITSILREILLMRYQKNLTHLKTLPSGANVGPDVQTSARPARIICFAKEGLS